MFSFYCIVLHCLVLSHISLHCIILMQEDDHMQNWVTACHGRWQLYDHNAMHSNIEILRKEYLKSKCEEKKNSCSKITMASNIQVLRKEMSTIFRDINTYLIGCCIIWKGWESVTWHISYYFSFHDLLLLYFFRYLLANTFPIFYSFYGW